MDKFGLSYEKLKKIRPDLIYCSLSGYGQTSPRQQWAGHDINYLALSGISSYSGTKQGGPPQLGVQMADLSGSFYAVQSLLAAIIHRMKTGEGTYIDVSMREAVLSLGIFQNNEYLNNDIVAEPQGGLLNGGSIYDYYKTSDGRYLSIGALEGKFIQRLLQTLGIETPPNEMHMLNGTVKIKIKEIIATKPLKHWIERFKKVDCCVEPVLRLDEVFTGNEREKWIEKIDFKEEVIRSLKHPVRFRH
jgi:crotonobetainyl-CoA:carnitine CoA-transferase CaiB-like acyl-CoA transferase